MRQVRRSGALIGSVAAIATAIVLAGVVVLAVGWRISGGQWFTVETPSMGRAAPIGTLLLTQPTTVEKISVGDIITFHEPGSGIVYSHRVVQKTAAGLRTRGDINPLPDPWTLTNADLIGKVAHRWWGMGWVLRAQPLLLLCLAAVWGLTLLVTPRWRSPARVVGVALSVSIAGLVLHPWVGIERISTTASASGVLIRAVSTGIIPIRASAKNGTGQALLVNGQDAVIPVTTAGHGGQYLITTSPNLSLGWWLAIILVCISPLLWCLVVGVRPLPPVLPEQYTGEQLPDPM